MEGIGRRAEGKERRAESRERRILSASTVWILTLNNILYIFERREIIDHETRITLYPELVKLNSNHEFRELH